MDKVKAFFAAPGRIRMLTVLYFLAVVAAKVLGWHEVEAALGFLMAWLPTNIGISPDEATATVLGVIALVKQLVQSARAPKPAPKA